MHNIDEEALEYFSAREFRRWWPFMSGRLLVALDKFRKLYGRPVAISAASGALGRWGGPFDYVSAHDVERHGKVLGVDVMPAGLDGPEDYAHAYKCAKAAGFVGFGVYPHWRPSPGLHLDVMMRPNRRAGHLLAKWRAYMGKDPETGKPKQLYAGLEDIMPEGWRP